MAKTMILAPERVENAGNFPSTLLSALFSVGWKVCEKCTNACFTSLLHFCFMLQLWCVLLFCARHQVLLFC